MGSRPSRGARVWWAIGRSPSAYVPRDNKSGVAREEAGDARALARLSCPLALARRARLRSKYIHRGYLHAYARLPDNSTINLCHPLSPLLNWRPRAGERASFADIPPGVSVYLLLCAAEERRLGSVRRGPV